MYKVSGLSDYLDKQEYSLHHRLFQDCINAQDKALVSTLEPGDQCLVNVKETGNTLVIERV